MGTWTEARNPSVEKETEQVAETLKQETEEKKSSKT